jgi:hypothetical protein
LVKNWSKKKSKGLPLWLTCAVFSIWFIYNWSKKKSRGLPLWFSRKVLSSHLVKKWSTQYQEAFLFDYLV